MSYRQNPPLLLLGSWNSGRISFLEIHNRKQIPTLAVSLIKATPLIFSTKPVGRRSTNHCFATGRADRRLKIPIDRRCQKYLPRVSRKTHDSREELGTLQKNNLLPLFLRIRRCLRREHSSGNHDRVTVSTLFDQVHQSTNHPNSDDGAIKSQTAHSRLPSPIGGVRRRNDKINLVLVIDHRGPDHLTGRFKSAHDKHFKSLPLELSKQLERPHLDRGLFFENINNHDSRMAPCRDFPKNIINIKFITNGINSAIHPESISSAERPFRSGATARTAMIPSTRHDEETGGTRRWSRRESTTSHSQPTMIIGVPREIKEQENRVALLPSGAALLVKRGHTVVVETDAGTGADYPDAEYLEAGAEIVTSPEIVFERADLVVKVKEPQPREVALLRPGQILFTYLHLAADKELTENLVASGASAVAYETVQIGHRTPLLEPMSEVAGRMSVMVGAYFLAKHEGGRGTLLGGVPGVLPGRVVIIGGGTCGVNAARVATGIGAQTTILEIDAERMQFLDATMPQAHTLYSSEAALIDLLPNTDLLVGAVLVPGTRAPSLVSREMVASMKNGTVIVDIAVDQGGCAETTHATSHENPVYVEEGVTHYCVSNMPGAFARTATQALTNVTFPYIQLLATEGFAGACARHPELVGGINTHGGALTYEGVAQAHGLEWTKPSL